MTEFQVRLKVAALRPFVPRFEKDEALLRRGVASSVQGATKDAPEALGIRTFKHKTVSARSRRIVPRVNHHGIADGAESSGNPFTVK